jgi:hypothetical protein
MVTNQSVVELALGPCLYNHTNMRYNRLPHCNAMLPAKVLETSGCNTFSTRVDQLYPTTQLAPLFMMS